MSLYLRLQPVYALSKPIIEASPDRLGELKQRRKSRTASKAAEFFGTTGSIFHPVYGVNSSGEIEDRFFVLTRPVHKIYKLAAKPMQ